MISSVNSIPLCDYIISYLCLLLLEETELFPIQGYHEEIYEQKEDKLFFSASLTPGWGPAN